MEADSALTQGVAADNGDSTDLVMYDYISKVKHIMMEGATCREDFSVEIWLGHLDWATATPYARGMVSCFSPSLFDETLNLPVQTLLAAKAHIEVRLRAGDELGDPKVVARGLTEVYFKGIRRAAASRPLASWEQCAIDEVSAMHTLSLSVYEPRARRSARAVVEQASRWA